MTRVDDPDDPEDRAWVKRFVENGFQAFEPGPDAPMSPELRTMFEEAGKPVPRMPTFGESFFWDQHRREQWHYWKRRPAEDPGDTARREAAFNQMWSRKLIG